MATTATTLGLGLPRSPPGYFTVLFSSVVIVMQSLAMYDPTDAMKQLGIAEPASAQFICMPTLSQSLFPFSPRTRNAEKNVYEAFALIAINAYELIGAMQDNWAVYWFSLISRTGAAGLMAYLGGGWAGLMPLELGSAVLLGACMAFSPAVAEKGKKV